MAASARPCVGRDPGRLMCPTASWPGMRAHLRFMTAAPRGMANAAANLIGKAGLEARRAMNE
jgi:hypothetical protein